MKKIVKNYAYTMYLGLALSIFANLNFLNWKFYIIAIPVVLLVEWRALVN